MDKSHKYLHKKNSEKIFYYSNKGTFTEYIT